MVMLCFQALISRTLPAISLAFMRSHYSVLILDLILIHNSYYGGSRVWSL